MSSLNFLSREKPGQFSLSPRITFRPINHHRLLELLKKIPGLDDVGKEPKEYMLMLYSEIFLNVEQACKRTLEVRLWQALLLFYTPIMEFNAGVYSSTRRVLDCNPPKDNATLLTYQVLYSGVDGRAICVIDAQEEPDYPNDLVARLFNSLIGQDAVMAFGVTRKGVKVIFRNEGGEVFLWPESPEQYDLSFKGFCVAAEIARTAQSPVDPKQSVPIRRIRIEQEVINAQGERLKVEALEVTFNTVNADEATAAAVAEEEEQIQIERAFDALYGQAEMIL